MTTETPKIAYTVKEVVATGLFSRSGLYRAMADGVITARKSGSRTVILADELERYRRAMPEAQIGRAA